MRTSELRVPLLHIAEPLREELDRYIFIVQHQMLLRRGARKVDQRVRIRRQAGDGTDDIPTHTSNPSATSQRTHTISKDNEDEGRRTS
jgi:hypothetical protein